MKNIIKNVVCSDKTKKKLYSNRNFFLLFQGQFVSNLGNAVQSVAVVWFILNIAGASKSGFYLALFFSCSLIPSIIFGPLTSVWVDRLDRKLIIVGVDLIKGVLILLLTLLTYFHFYPLFSLFFITFICAFFNTFFIPAVNATIPNIVRSEDLLKANSIAGICFHLPLIIGAAAAGILYYKIGIVGVFTVNGFSFILSGISEMFINIPADNGTRYTTNKVKSKFTADLKSGFFYVKNRRPLVVALIFAGALIFVSDPFFAILLPKIIKFSLKLNAADFGYLGAAFSIGALAGMFVISFLPRRKKLFYFIFIAGLFGLALTSILYGIPIIPGIQKQLTSTNIFIFFCIVSFFRMIFDSLVNVPISTIFQKRVDDSYRGRFFGVQNTMFISLKPLSFILIGILSGFLQIYIIIFILSFIFLLLCFFISVSSDIKELFNIQL
ncbi:MAG TPA: MFS transporter [Victivallales bacterium]|nr:MFS transporter [Victivallales bacterium]